MALNFRPRAALYGLPDIIPSGTLPGDTSVPSVAPATIADAAAGTPVVPRHPSFFGQGGAGRSIAGAIGDAFLQMGGAQPIYAPAANSQRQMALAQKLAEAKRQSDRQDWLYQQQWERDNPKPISNDTVNDYNFRIQTLGKDAADEWLRNQGDPVVTVTLPGDRVYSGPRSGLAAALSGGASEGSGGPPPPERLPADFDFGGGGSSNATGGFP